MWPQDFACLFSWMSSYHTIRFASFFDSYNLPMETPASSSLRPASYAIEKKTVLLTCLRCNLDLGHLGVTRLGSVLMVPGQRSHFQWCGFLATIWQEKGLHVICTLYDPDNMIVRNTHANLDDQSEWEEALNKPSRDVKILGWSDPIWNTMMNFGDHIFNEYPKAVSQGEQHDENDNDNLGNTAHRCVRYWIKS